MREIRDEEGDISTQGYRVDVQEPMVSRLVELLGTIN